LEADVDVVRDVLDTSVIDRNGREMGRVDGIVIEPRPNQPVHLTALLIGPSALGDRLHPAVGRVVRRIEKRFGLDRDQPARVAFADVDEIGAKIRLRLTISETAVAAVEQRLRSWLVRLPGSR
jgi:sporulation protein YlmC with PRC-barrel domain